VTLQILVADDSTPIQKVIKIAFSKHETVILTAGSLLEATKVVETESIDLVIADSSLPGSKSPEDFKRLKGTRGAIPVIMLTGSYDSIREVDLKMAGFESVIKKPFDASDLVSLSEGLIGSKGSLQPQTTKDGLPNTIGLPTTHSTRSEMTTPPVSVPPSTTQSMRTSIPLPPPPTLNRSTSNNSNLDGPEASQEPSLRVSAPVTTTVSQKDNGLGIPSFLLEDPGKELNSGTSSNQSNTNSKILMPENKGRPAFEPTMDEDLDLSPFSIPSVQRKDSGEFAKQDPSTGAGRISEFEHELMKKIESKLGLEFRSDLKSELQNDLRALVEQYCREHFKSVAKEVLTQEIRRLADEKAKYLVDR
jgi:DNA-binding response OmpR family regulator